MADLNDLKFDKRILQRNVQSGLVTRAEVEAHLKALPDVEGNAEVIDFSAGRQDPEQEADAGSPAEGNGT